MGSYAKTHERGASGGVDQGGRASTIAGFAPQTAGPRNAAGEATAKDEFDILFTTDVLAEGVNLQQAGQMINYDLPWNPMRIVQRHGRVDRIGSKHDYVYLGLFFPAERLDALLELEARLEAKLALADAAVGAGEVLPGRGPGHEVNLADDQVIDEFEKLLDAGGSSASLSGEEYRRRLFGAFSMDPVNKADILEPAVRIGQRLREPGRPRQRLRLLHQDRHQRQAVVPLRPGDRRLDRHDTARMALPIVSSDTLISLRVGDPQNATAERWLPEEVYDKAFDAWEVARDSVLHDMEGAHRPQRLPARLAALVPRRLHARHREGRLPRRGPHRAAQPAYQRAVGQGLASGARGAEPGADRRGAHRARHGGARRGRHHRSAAARAAPRHREARSAARDMDGGQGNSRAWRRCRMTFDPKLSVPEGLPPNASAMRSPSKSCGVWTCHSESMVT